MAVGWGRGAGVQGSMEGCVTYTGAMQQSVWNAWSLQHNTRNPWKHPCIPMLIACCMHLFTRPTGFKVALEEARERSKAAGKKSGQEGLKFQAEATGWLQKNNIALTVSVTPEAVPDQNHHHLPSHSGRVRCISSAFVHTTVLPARPQGHFGLSPSGYVHQQLFDGMHSSYLMVAYLSLTSPPRTTRPSTQSPRLL
jgi:hypothetical protein